MGLWYAPTAQRTHAHAGSVPSAGCFGYLGAADNDTDLEGLRVQVVAVSAAAGAAMRSASRGAGSVQQYVKQWSTLDPR